MLDAFIIEQLRQRRERDHAKADEARIQLPAEPPPERDRAEAPRDDAQGERGSSRAVVIEMHASS